MKPKLLIFLFLSATLVSSCGYRLSGTGKYIPESIKTIAIPDFNNKTLRYQAEQYVTFAVREEFIRRSHLQLVDSLSRADSVIEGVIKEFIVQPISYSEQAAANLYKVTIVIDIKYINLKTNHIIFENDNLKFSDNYNVEDDDFYSQETGAMAEISREFAASVVTTILENF